MAALYYMIGAADPNPLTEAHFTFADGYLIAGPTRASFPRRSRSRAARTSIAHSTQFVSLMPRDHYADFLGGHLPEPGLHAGTADRDAGSLRAAAEGRREPARSLSNLQPSFIAAYGEHDRITIAGAADIAGMNPSSFAHGSLLGIAGNALPLGQFLGTRQTPACVSQ